jgi:ankyrin repeat protein
VRKLLAAGADPNRQNLYGSAPLHFAVFRQHRAVVELLLRERKPGELGVLGVSGSSSTWNEAATPLALATKVRVHL